MYNILTNQLVNYMYFGFILHCLVGDGGGLYREFSNVCREKGKIAAYDHVIERVDEMGLEALESFLEELNEGELARSGVNSIGLGKRVLSRLIEAEEEGSLVKLLRCLHEGGLFSRGRCKGLWRVYTGCS